jgi:DNA-directed RNA polymerase subunit beta'
MRCTHTNGVCAKCVGLDEKGQLPEKGTNIGVMSAQALGERGTQMAMKAFHSGGVYEGRKAAEKSITAGGLDRALSLLYLPERVKGSATLAEGDGVVKDVRPDPAGGFNVDIDVKRGKNQTTTRSHYVPADRKLTVKKRSKVRIGDPISSGPVNPHELLPLTGVSKVQGHLARELHDIYGAQGIKRRHSEVLVRAVTGVTKVQDPGDNGDLIHGDFATAMDVAAWNAKNKGKKPVVHTPVLRGVRQVPVDVSEDWLARMNHERLKETVVEGAQRGWSTELHGRHPIPALIKGTEFGKGTEERPWLY